ncbi:hypothetical protein DIU31_031740 [Mucilaginibacter rubeus]|uniref:Plasmid transfer protein n=1 Tax=Mucilaginibacter rubeus TaxID=2027860 RepID=A0AAE6JLW0_9SPHI|nr:MULTISPECIES: hypothetical protein [Mucilaginibacter]QEM07853.1 hypothetical protein DIU31_031740 [Mucilaginibacter rubeus]QEM20305.1 hypothetical protein DIU38_031345 [Mucilaginibacter gossypii]QTE42977.1 hypothetical protein J3L19_29320 [Mucilaginibacter rubeus]QTE49578.1 hypothetical protein J3L21_29280 [Mucilaginibacter rubeus]QTE54674.1 hypothetical protein J3L23_20905 [Mucilaginibacter rubeus]
MKGLPLIILSFLSTVALAQEMVVDPQHLLVVQENQAVRMAAEGTHQDYLKKINDNVNTINANESSVVAAQTMIYNSLANVNSALKDGLMVKQISRTTTDIIYYLNESMMLAKDDPLLFLVTMKIQNEFGPKATAMVSDISGFILKSDGNVLADYNGRDQLLRKVVQQLQILDGMAYGTWKAMYWAKERGVLKTLNPFASYINKDRAFAAQIIQNAKFLRQ